MLVEAGIDLAKITDNDAAPLCNAFIRFIRHGIAVFKISGQAGLGLLYGFQISRVDSDGNICIVRYFLAGSFNDGKNRLRVGGHFLVQYFPAYRQRQIENILLGALNKILFEKFELRYNFAKLGQVRLSLLQAGLIAFIKPFLKARIILLGIAIR